VLIGILACGAVGGDPRRKRVRVLLAKGVRPRDVSNGVGLIRPVQSVREMVREREEVGIEGAVRVDLALKEFLRSDVVRDDPLHQLRRIGGSAAGTVRNELVLPDEHVAPRRRQRLRKSRRLQRRGFQRIRDARRKRIRERRCRGSRRERQGDDEAPAR
jgi:hypothetical protein